MHDKSGFPKGHIHSQTAGTWNSPEASAPSMHSFWNCFTQVEVKTAEPRDNQKFTQVNAHQVYTGMGVPCKLLRLHFI